MFSPTMMKLVPAQGAERSHMVLRFSMSMRQRPQVRQAEAEVHEVDAVELAEDKIDKLEREASETAEEQGLDTDVVRLVCFS
jgi:hypothetical protein